ncbi:MAG: hypothetical protein FJZ43_04495 [Candidatus Staskawiczbacteria bacterium]|nr:hypothetical protein [Candidatus Staskawiczbacteria bacterium]
MFFNFLFNIINAPVQPFLQIVLNLLSADVHTQIFLSLWAIIVYMLSMFYALLIVGAGVSFLISGYDSEKRESAKEWLRNIIIMIILVQSSFFLYQLALDLASSMTSATLNIVDENFFSLQVSSTIGLGLALSLGMVYVVVLILTALVLTLRYAIVAIGIVLFPIGIFFYFIPKLRGFGSLIFNVLGISIFITFFDAILLIGFSALMNVGVFNNLQIIILISAFLLIDILMVILLFFAITRAAFSIYSKVGRWNK